MESIVTVTFSGGLDISRYPEIAAGFRNCPDSGECVIVDLSDAKWLDSVFMTDLLLFYRKNLKLNRAMIVVARGGVARMLTIAGLAKRLRIVSDYDDAKRIPLNGKKRARKTVGPPTEFHFDVPDETN
ncbi:MAG: STAS domain-containing protein [Candidatus Eremiobacteraeota bacterium]|nr:STAS domain-containing protein [Candidatus Eremiobacteraeota bacterium]